MFIIYRCLSCIILFIYNHLEADKHNMDSSTKDIFADLYMEQIESNVLTPPV